MNDPIPAPTVQPTAPPAKLPHPTTVAPGSAGAPPVPVLFANYSLSLSPADPTGSAVVTITPIGTPGDPATPAAFATTASRQQLHDLYAALLGVFKQMDATLLTTEP